MRPVAALLAGTALAWALGSCGSGAATVPAERQRAKTATTGGASDEDGALPWRGWALMALGVVGIGAGIFALGRRRGAQDDDPADSSGGGGT